MGLMRNIIGGFGGSSSHPQMRPGFTQPQFNFQQMPGNNSMTPGWQTPPTLPLQMSPFSPNTTAVPKGTSISKNQSNIKPGKVGWPNWEPGMSGYMPGPQASWAPIVPSPGLNPVPFAPTGQAAPSPSAAPAAPKAPPLPTRRPSPPPALPEPPRHPFNQYPGMQGQTAYGAPPGAFGGRGTPPAPQRNPGIVAPPAAGSGTTGLVQGVKNSLANTNAAKTLNNVSDVWQGKEPSRLGPAQVDQPPVSGGGAQYDPSRAMSKDEIYNIMLETGFTPEEARIGLAVIGGESAYDPMAHNPRGNDDSYGLFQINMRGSNKKHRINRYGLDPENYPAQLADPRTNIAIAYDIFKDAGRKWDRDWGAYTNKSYMAFLE